MDIRKIKKLIELLEETGISEIEIKEAESSIRLSRQAQPVESYHRSVQPLSLPVSAHIPHTSAHEKKTEENQHRGHLIHSPMVGTLYLSSAPEAKPFVAVGQTVNAGDTLCIIEAMKMFNEIEADVAGTITEVLVVNGDPVQYDQVLFVIE